MAAARHPEAEWTPTIGFLCPLFVELKAVKATFDEDPDTSISVDDETTFHYGRISSRDVVAVQLPHDRTGPIDAAKFVNRLLEYHESLKGRDSYCFLVGIAGGIWSDSHDVRLGDIVIARQIWNWSAGKSTEGGFVRTRFPERVKDSLHSKLDKFLDKRDQLSEQIMERIGDMRTKMEDKGEMEDKWCHQSTEQDILFVANHVHESGETCASCDPTKVVRRHPRNSVLPVIHDGLIASGSVVLKNSRNRTKLQERDVLAVEMEACGIPKELNFFTIRGISDYADSHKNDRWQPYSAATAAACARLLIDSLLRQVETRSVTDMSSVRACTVLNGNPTADNATNTANGERANNSQSQITGLHGLSETISHSPDDYVDSAGESGYKICDITAQSVAIRLTDGGEDGGLLEHEFNTSHVLLTAHSNENWFFKEHRLEIKPVCTADEQDFKFWLPMTKVKVERRDVYIAMTFSNCKQKSEKKSKQYHEWYEAIYSPRTPNVCLHIWCQQEDDATKLEDLLLNGDGLWSPEMKHREREFACCTVQNGSLHDRQGLRARGICFWRHGSSPCLKHKYSQFDTAFFSDRLDFEFTMADEKVDLSLRHMKKIKYVPEHFEYVLSWPSEEINANTDGHPAVIELGSASTFDSTRIVVPTESFTDLLDFTIGYGTECTARGWYQVDFGFTSSILGREPKLCPGQMSIWTKDDVLYCLVRHKDADRTPEDHTWEYWTLRSAASAEKGETPRLTVEEDMISITIKNISPSSGTYLSLNQHEIFQPRGDLRPRRRSGSIGNKTKNAKIQFRSQIEADGFRELVRDYTTQTSELAGEKENAVYASVHN